MIRPPVAALERFVFDALNSLTTTPPPRATPVFAPGPAARMNPQAADGDALQRHFGEFVGGVLIAPVLESMQNSPFKTGYLNGGRGEQAFGAQLSLELARRIGRVADAGFGKRFYAAATRALQQRRSSGEGNPDEAANAAANTINELVG